MGDLRSTILLVRWFVCPPEPGLLNYWSAQKSSKMRPYFGKHNAKHKTEEAGCGFVVLSAAGEDPPNSAPFSQGAIELLIAAKWHVAAVACASLTERPTTQDTRRPPIGTRTCTCACFGRGAKYADTCRWPDDSGGGQVPLLVMARFARWRWCSVRGCLLIKSAFFWLRHAAPRNQHLRNRGSARRLCEMDLRLGGSAVGPL
jgi:hypothetical protein